MLSKSSILNAGGDIFDLFLDDLSFIIVSATIHSYLFMWQASFFIYYYIIIYYSDIFAVWRIAWFCCPMK